MQWKREELFVKRDENGVIVAINERTPAGFVDQAKQPEVTRVTRLDNETVRSTAK